jgi:hypothetical protein
MFDEGKSRFPGQAVWHMVSSRVITRPGVVYHRLVAFAPIRYDEHIARDKKTRIGQHDLQGMTSAPPFAPACTTSVAISYRSMQWRPPSPLHIPFAKVHSEQYFREGYISISDQSRSYIASSRYLTMRSRFAARLENYVLQTSLNEV